MTLSNTIMIVNCHIKKTMQTKMISIKIMDLNTFIDVISMLLRCLNLVDGLHATRVALILKLPQFQFVSMSN